MSDDYWEPALCAQLSAAMRGTVADALPVDPDHAFDAIRFHGIAGLLARQPAAMAQWPEALRILIGQEARLLGLWEATHRMALLPLLAALAEASVAVVAMKGTALAYSLYAEPSARQRGDTDLLIAPADLARARRCLADAGFSRKQSPHGLMFQESWLHDSGIGFVHAVDLHWQPSDSPVLQRILPAAVFFEDSVPLPRLAEWVRASDPVLTFIQGAINQAWHQARGYFVGEARIIGGQRLIWAYDNHLLAGGFSPADWDRLAELATTRGLAPVVAAALAHANAACATKVPETVRARLAAAPQSGDLLHYLQTTHLIGTFWQDLRATTGLGARLAFLMAHAFPDADHLREKYPHASRWPLPLLHLRRWAETLGRFGAGRAH